jgi:Family of unknown function (DUF5681)
MSDNSASTGKQQPWRFQPGKSGNPKGRGRGVKNRATRLLDAMADADAAEVLQQVLNKAKGGNLGACAMILDRVWPVPKGRPITAGLVLPAILARGDIVTALNAVLLALAAGKLTVDEGTALAGIIARATLGFDPAALADPLGGDDEGGHVLRIVGGLPPRGAPRAGLGVHDDLVAVARATEPPGGADG